MESVLKLEKKNSRRSFKSYYSRMLRPTISSVQIASTRDSTVSRSLSLPFIVKMCLAWGVDTNRSMFSFSMRLPSATANMVFPESFSMDEVDMSPSKLLFEPPSVITTTMWRTPGADKRKKEIELLLGALYI